MVPLSNIEFSTDIAISLNDSTKDTGSFQGVFNDKSGSIPIMLNYKILNEVLIVWGWIDQARFAL